MKTRLLHCLFIIFFFLFSFSASYAAETRYIVRFKAAPINMERTSRSDVVSFLQENLQSNMDTIKLRTPLKDVQPLWVANSFAFTGTAEQAAEFEKNPMVAEVVESKYEIYIEPSQTTPVRGNSRAIQWGVERVKAPKLWQKYKIDGTGVIVGVLDTGINPDHPALRGKILAFKDFTNEKSAKPIDTRGHGSHVSGTIAGGNGLGVAPGAKLLVARVFDSNGGTSPDTLIAAMQWMMDPDGNPKTNDAPRVINNSWGSPNSNKTTYWTAVENWTKAKILPVFSAGNNGKKGGKVSSPGAFPHSWAVAAVTSENTLAAFSSTGPIYWQDKKFIKPDIAAPGAKIISCSHKGSELVSKNGTSMAAPHAAGVAALLLQADPSLTAKEIIRIISSTALDLGEKGKDSKFGFGLIDAEKALKVVLAKARLIASYQHYEEMLATEEALSGIQTTSTLTAPLAKYIVEKSAELSDKEFDALSDEVNESCSSSAQNLLKAARALRTARKVHQAD